MFVFYGAQVDLKYILQLCQYVIGNRKMLQIRLCHANLPVMYFLSFSQFEEPDFFYLLHQFEGDMVGCIPTKICVIRITINGVGFAF